MMKVKSVSSKALDATLRDINAVTSLTDRVAGNFLHGKPPKVIFHDLADDMISICDEGTVSLEHSTGMNPRMKRGLVTTDSEFSASGNSKRLKTEVPQNLWCMFMFLIMISFELHCIIYPSFSSLYFDDCSSLTICCWKRSKRSTRSLLKWLWM